MNGQSVESGSHLTQKGISHIQEEATATPQMQPLDASKLQITLTASPREVPTPNSAEVFAMKYVFPNLNQECPPQFSWDSIKYHFL